MNDRELVLTVIEKFSPTKIRTETLISQALKKCSNKAFVNDLCCGIVRNIPLIDRVIETIASITPQKTSPHIYSILRCGVYEIIFCPEQKEYAIVNEWVELSGNKKMRGFVNAILRNVIRSIEDRNIASPYSEYFVPNITETGCLFKKAILPNPKDLPAYLAQAYSLPQWLVSGWAENYGNEETAQICAGSNRKPSIYLRPNKTKVIAGELLETLCEADFDAKAVGNMIAISKLGCAVNQLPGYNEGLFCIQDITAFGVGEFIAPQEGEVILDLCSAPGTKTTHLAELLMGTGEVIATDIDSERLKMVAENKERLGLDNITIVEYDKIDRYIAGLKKLDTILLDVPCSNTGVLAKRLDMRYRITQSYIREVAQRQKDIISDTLSRFPNAKRLFYSTCSIESSENADLLHNCNLTPFTILPGGGRQCLQSNVSLGNDGGYVGLLERNKTIR